MAYSKVALLIAPGGGGHERVLLRASVQFDSAMDRPDCACVVESGPNVNYLVIHIVASSERGTGEYISCSASCSPSIGNDLDTSAHWRNHRPSTISGNAGTPPYY